MEKTIRFGLFLFLITGMLFAGCQTPTEVDDDDMGGSLEQTNDTSNSGSSSTTTGQDPVSVVADSKYKDGSYSSTSTYNSPAGVDSVGVSLTLKDGVITSVSISKLAASEASISYQTLFADGISSLVVGKSIDSLGSIGAVNGSSLTPKAFNTAVQDIKSQAENA